MSYVGSKIEIPLGSFGVHTDDPEDRLALGEVTRCVNVDMYHGMLEKAPGSKRWNGTELPAGIKNAFDWHPVEAIQTPVVACADGKMYKFLNPYRYVEITGEALSFSGQTSFVEAQPTSGLPLKRLIFFSGSNTPQVIVGNSITRRPMQNPAVDWVSGNFPSFGMMYQERLFVSGFKQYPHLVLESKIGDPEDFSTISNSPTTDFQFADIFPGEGEYISGFFQFRGALFVTKYPTGVYKLESDGSYSRISTAFGGISAQGNCEVIEDTLISNQFGTVTSMAAAFQLGNVKFADLFSNLRCEDMIRQETNALVPGTRWSLYYSSKKQAYFTYRSFGSVVINKFVVVDYNTQKPRAYILDKDNPDFLFLLKDDYNIKRPAYGHAGDGYLYLMDSPDRLVGSTGYSSSVTFPYMQFNQNTNKLFDFLEIEAEYSGNWSLSCDVFIDAAFSETIQFKQGNNPVLAAAQDSSCFQLDQDRLFGRQTTTYRHALHGRGRNISFRFYTGTEAQNFKMTKLVVYARIGAEDKK